MKKMLFTFALMALPLFALKAMAQETPTDTTVYEVVEKMPEYPGGIKKLMEYIRTSTDNYWKKIYPKGKPVYPCESIIGRIIVSFVVNENGQVTDPVIKRSLDPILDKEAIRIVKSMPRWIPGESKGKKVKVRYTLPFQF
jgi:TonB family protein